MASILTFFDRNDRKNEDTDERDSQFEKKVKQFQITSVFLLQIKEKN